MAARYKRDSADGARGQQLSAVPGRQRASVAVPGAGGVARKRAQPRRVGVRSALNRARRLRTGLGSITPAQEALVLILARLWCHLDNCSGRLFVDGELREDGEPKAAMARLLELSTEIRRLYAAVFGAGEEPEELLAKLRRQR
jgi:hypothetical protein